MNIETAFRSVYGREPSPEETNRFNRIARELGIRDNDAIWAVAFLLGHHLDLAMRMPERVEQLIARSLDRYEVALSQSGKRAEAELVAVKARIEEKVSKAIVESAQMEIARAAQTVASSTARKSWLQWIGGAAVVGMLIVIGTFYWGYNAGNSTGYARALDVKMASSWAATSMGQAAFRLDQNGDLTSLVRCDREGWSVERSVNGRQKLCVVRPRSDGSISGWRIP